MSAIEGFATAALIPRGTPGEATVTYRAGKGAFGNSAKMEIEFNLLELNGRRIPLSGKVRQECEGNSGAAVGAVVAVSVFGAFVTGHSATITNGAAFVALNAAAQAEPAIRINQRLLVRPQAGTPALPQGVKVFSSGAVRTVATPRMRLLSRAKLAPSPEFQVMSANIPAGTPDKFTLTPGQPFIPGIGGLNFLSTSAVWTYDPTLGPTSFAMMVGYQPNTAAQSAVSLQFNTVQNKTYLLDVSMIAGPVTQGCEILIVGPNGDQESQPCNNANYSSGTPQHLLFAYHADKGGITNFAIKVANSAADFYSVDVAAVQ